MQEGFLRLSRDADTLVTKWRAGASLGGWLCTVVRNWCIDHLRRKQAAPRQRADDQRVFLGIDLLAAPGADGLMLRGLTSDLRLELSMSRTGRALGPWLLALGSLLVLVVGLCLTRRQ